jgi:DeoR/GlpR family transcriptional regulator of sugar metabolism
MEIPKFLLADNSKFGEVIFVLHTDYPKFLINIVDDSIYWFEEFNKEEKKELDLITPKLIQEAFDFYDNEIRKIK